MDDVRVDTHHSEDTTGGALTPIGLSVVIACYNGADTLGTQLEALAAQTCREPFEVIVADNGSTDSSAVLAESFAGRLPIRVVDASDVKGPGHARNRGVESARGPIIAFCDADDEVAPGWLDAALDCMVEHDFVAGLVDITKLNSSRVTRSRTMAQQEGLQDSGTGIGLKHAGAGNMVLKKDVFAGVGGFDEGLRCLQDTDLCWRIQLAGTPLVFYRDLMIYTRLRSTLRTMMRQGYLYGVAFAKLEHRYGRAEGEPATGEGGAAESDRARPTLGVRRLLQGAVKARDLGVGGTAWQLAWHLGHRVEGRRDSRGEKVTAGR